MKIFFRVFYRIVFSYFSNPEFGVEFSIEDQQSDQPSTRLESRVDDIEILQSREHTDSYAVNILFNIIDVFSKFSILRLI